MKHLLVPVDFSEYANNACEYALQLAARYKAKITLLHAYHIPVIDPLMPVEYISDLDASVQKTKKHLLEEIAVKLNKIKADNKLGDFEIGYSLTMGFAVDEIISAGEKLQPDLIVMGRRYTEGMAKILIGSITAAVLEEAGCPVLIVPENVKYDEGPVNVLYAAEYGEAENKTINKLLSFTKPLKAKVHCVHISEKPNAEAEQRLAEMEISYADAVENHHLVFYNASSENVMDGLSHYAEKNNIHLMAMLTHKRSFFVKLFDRSFTRKVAFKINIPLLVFHDKE